MNPSTGLQYGRSPGRKDLQPGQVARLMIVDVVSRELERVLETELLIESPNWTPDGRWLIVNGGGELYRIAADGSTELEMIPTGNVAQINNDHVLSPDGATIYFSAQGHLYRVPLVGGQSRRVSNDHGTERGYSYWLHGVSPDNETLAYVSIEPTADDPRGRRNLATIPAGGGEDRALTEGLVPYDGPEYSPDGEWLYYNSEEAASRPGHAQIFRMRPDGSAREQLTFDDRVNWFPHLSPDGAGMAYISYAPQTISHPADVDVELRVMDASGGPSTTVCTVFGGQGTLNTNSWAPDSRRFAYVEYPAADS